MSILSVQFMLFVLVLAGIYYIFPPKFKPYIILAGSVFFYLTFDWRYSLFLLLSIVTTFFGAIIISKRQDKRSKKIWLASVLVLNIGLLFAVKYLPYFMGLVSKVFDFQDPGISLLVPIGISFYTLQVSGYCIDVYRGKYEPQRNIFLYASFATFFPLILQGPISRYDQLSKTLYKRERGERIYENITYGAQLMLWGFFQKLVIADRAAMIVNNVFPDYTSFDSFGLVIAGLCYTIQIYTDFSGCVDICRGAGQILGVDIMENFKQPYFSISITDFWRRWHIALSSWLRDYLYIPLGGNRKGKVRKYINVLIVFLVSGIWHGVGLHYIAWGLIHGFYQVIGALTMPARLCVCKALKIDRGRWWYLTFQRIITFVLVSIAWVFFRAEGVMMSVNIVKNMFTGWSTYNFATIQDLGLNVPDLIVLLVAVLIVLTISICKHNGIRIRQGVAAIPLPIRWIMYLALFFVVLVFGIYGPGYSGASFIYMNF